MKKFKITVDGVVYNVEVEEVGEHKAAPTPQPPAREKSPTPLAASATEPPKESAIKIAQPQPAPGKANLTSPMPGTILKVLADIGDKVEQGQPLIILEAMKMENKIAANATGTITRVEVSPGQTVDTGQLLLTID